MQKTATRALMKTNKVAKKAKKMGSPSPPKKKKVAEQKNNEDETRTAAAKNKTPLKKIAVVAKKGNVGKKNLKITKKLTPVKVASNKNITVKVAQKTPSKKVIKPKSNALTKTNIFKGKTATIAELKSPDKVEESGVASSKSKKPKKSVLEEQTNQNEITKSTAKKQINSKLNKKSVDSDVAVKLTLPIIPIVDVSKELILSASTKKLIDKKSTPVSDKTKLESSEKTGQKSKPKKKVVNKLNKIVKKTAIKKQKTKRALSTKKTEVFDAGLNDKIKTEINTEIKQEKDCKLLETEKKPSKKNEQDDITKETIAKLLKEANKTIMKRSPKKKKDSLKIKTIPTSGIVKKTNVMKIMPKKKDKNQISITKEPDEEKNESSSKKNNKKIIKAKAKAIKTEDKSLVKEEKVAKESDKKIKTNDEESSANTDDSTSDELTLNVIREQSNSSPSTTKLVQSKKQENLPVKSKSKKITKIKSEAQADTEKKSRTIKQIKQKSKSANNKKKILLINKKITKERKRSASTDTEQKGRKLKLYSWWTGPKRHRVASLNALAKVHCLYENESRGAFYDTMKRSPPIKDSNSDPEHEPASEPTIEASTRTLRSVPGLRGAGKHWDMHDETSTSSSSEDSSYDSSVEVPKRKLLTPPPSYKQKQREVEKKPEDKEKKKPVRKRRNRTELIMDLKDMVVRKRMASLNASAILAASYSVEKKPFRSPRSDTTETSDSDASVMSDIVDKKRQCYDPELDVKKEDTQDHKVIEVRASPNKKVAVILNQDTDVTITGVYVNSTTRSTHHEGYCSIAGMQYRISATSHTQTAATAVATETLLHSVGEHGPPEQPCKSYTPLSALSSMQPPGTHSHPHGPPLSPGRRHGCSSAFSAPVYGPPPAHHHHPGTEQAYLHGYYQPAGPLITAHQAHQAAHQVHHHSHAGAAPSSASTSSGKTAPVDVSPSPPPTHQPPPSSTGTAESSDNEVIITSTNNGSEQVPVTLPPPPQTYRYAATQYPPGAPHAPAGYSYTYPPSQYYHSAPGGFPSQQQHFHHDICYPSTGYPPSYLHPKTYATTFRRYIPPPGPAGPQYYSTNPELYSAPPSSAQSSQVVSASNASASSYQPPPTGPPPPTLVETYAPPPPVPPTIVEPYPPPHHYYASYGPGPTPAPPACYSHSPPTRNLTFIDAAYQSCPCPMQSCPKNVHTGPLTGDGKRSNAISKEAVPLPPVALALPFEPASVAGPPSPARGSAGMPPPPSPAGATYQPTPVPKWDAKQEETILESKTITTTEKRTKARLGKSMVRNSIANGLNSIPNLSQTQGMLLMCHNQQLVLPEHAADVSNVKREVESPEDVQLQPPEAITPPATQIEERLPLVEQISPCINQIFDSKIDTEVQNSSEECNKRLSLEDVNQNVKNEDCKDSPVPVTQNLFCRKKSVSIVEDDTLPQSQIQGDGKSTEDAIDKQINHQEVRLGVKRKYSLDTPTGIIEDDYKVQVKKPKTNSKNKHNNINGSYKDLIKKSNKCIKINNGKRKLNMDTEIKDVELEEIVCKTPKIAAGRKKTTKRKKSVTKEEQFAKKAKTSKPLVASNLHNSKQNVKNNKNSKISSDLSENKEPMAKQILKKPQVNSKFTSNLSNVDRTIESVILDSVYPSDESVRTSVNNKESVTKQTDKQIDVKATDNSVAKTNTNLTKPPNKVTKIGSGRCGTSKRKIKANGIAPLPLPIPRIPRKSLQLPRWSNGWSWEGEPFQGKIFLNSDEAMVTRKCYPSMRHAEGDVIAPRDCVLLKAGPRKIDLPFVAKVAALWEDEEGEMMMSLLWYYRPEHTEQGRRPIDQPDEVFASRHKDTNSVACIEDKCYVLTFNEYCRYRRSVRSVEEGITNLGRIVPLPEGGSYFRKYRQPPIQQTTSPDLVFFCRQVYDFRQKRLVKNPS